MVGDIALGEHQCAPRDQHYAFIRATSDSRRKVALAFVRDVDSDHGEVAIVKFQDVGATSERDRALTIQVGIGSEAFQDHAGISL